MAQTSYNFKTPCGVAGGLFDLSDSVIDSRLNAENDGVMLLGLGVVKGSTDAQVKIPTSASVAADFCGVTVNGFTNELGMNGSLTLRNLATVGILRKGRIWCRCLASLTVAVGDPVYLVTDGDNAGCFTNALGANTGVELKGCYFAGAKGSSDLYPIDIDVNAVKAAVAVEAAGIGGLSDVVITTPSNGQVLKYDGTDKVWENGTDAT